MLLSLVRSADTIIIFSKSGFTDGLRELGDKGEITLLTLEDIYG